MSMAAPIRPGPRTPCVTTTHTHHVPPTGGRCARWSPGRPGQMCGRPGTVLYVNAAATPRHQWRCARHDGEIVVVEAARMGWGPPGGAAGMSRLLMPRILAAIARPDPESAEVGVAILAMDTTDDAFLVIDRQGSSTWVPMGAVRVCDDQIAIAANHADDIRRKELRQ